MELIDSEDIQDPVDNVDANFKKSVEMDKPRNRCSEFFVNNWFILATFIGVAAGFGIALGVRITQPDETTISWISK